MPTIKDVASYIISYFQERGGLITNLKLQKLLYYVQGWYLAFHDGNPAFDGEFEAWIHGPVNNEIYQQFKSKQWRPILDQQSKVTLGDDLKDLVDKVLEVYGGDSAIDLELRTHREAPWIEARGNLPEDSNCSIIITKESMYNYFSGLLEHH